MNDKYMSHEEFFRKQYQRRSEMLVELEEFVGKCLDANMFEHVVKANIFKEKMETEVEMLKKYLDNEISVQELFKFYDAFTKPTIQHIEGLLDDS